jgi:hypothetical protein
MQTLSIQLETLVGDADLIVSTTNPFPVLSQGQLQTAFASRLTDPFDSITLSRDANFTLNTTIYIGIYAHTLAAYQLSFEPTYTSQYVALLAGAIPLNESQPYFVQYLQEYQETFFSFTPWWSMAENRTLVFAADVIFNNIFFYSEPNDYPLYYNTALIDKDNVIAIDA